MTNPPPDVLYTTPFDTVETAVAPDGVAGATKTLVDAGRVEAVIWEDSTELIEAA